MSRALLKFNGGSVHDYATIADDSPRPSCSRNSGGYGFLVFGIVDALVQNSRSRSIIALHPEVRGPA